MKFEPRQIEKNDPTLKALVTKQTLDFNVDIINKKN